jgi:multidrug resistance efflux pump
MSTAPETSRLSRPPVSGSGPRGLWLLLPVTALASLAGMGTVALLQTVRYERFPGHLQAAEVTLSAPRDARLNRIVAEAGGSVASGAPVFELVDEQLDSDIEQQQGLLAALDKEVAQVEAKLLVELQERRRVLRQELFETKLKSAAFLRQKFSSEVEQLAWKQVVEDMDETAGGSGSLVRATGFSSNDRESDRVAALLKQEAATNAQEVSSAQAEICDQRMAELSAIERELPEQLRRSMGLEVLAQRQSEAKTRLERLTTRKGELSVPAPATGTVGVYQARVGDHIPAHAPIVQLFDEDRPHVVVDVPSDRIAEFQPGKSLKLVFPGNREASGRIEAIPPQTSRTGTDGRAVVSVLVVPRGKLWPVVPFGSRVEALHERGGHE